MASRLFAMLSDGDEFGRTVARSSEKLAALTRDAITDHQAGKTDE